MTDTKPQAKIDVVIDGKTISVEPTATIFEAARRLGIEIPALCHRPDLGLNPVAVCRACMVDVGERAYPAACARQCSTLVDEKTHKAKAVQTHTPGVEHTRKTLVELLLAEHPSPCKRHLESRDCELEMLGEKYGLLKPLPPKAKVVKPAVTATVPGTLPSKSITTPLPKLTIKQQTGVHTASAIDSPFWSSMLEKKQDTSNGSIAVDHSACILCDRCVRACGDVAGHEIIGRIGKGYATTIGFDNDKPMGESDCVNCGWCMVACPTGALVYTGTRKEAGFADALSVDDMAELPFIQAAKVSKNFLKRFEGGIRLRLFEKGELICRQGDRGHTAFYIDSGKINVYLEVQKAVEAEVGIFERLMGKVKSFKPVKQPAKLIPIDAAVDLTEAKPVAQLPEFESMSSRLVGEASCRNGQPRSASLRAAEETVVLEMHRDVLDILLKSPTFRADFEQNNRRRMVQNYLRMSPLFAGLPEAEYTLLEQESELVSYSAGDTVFKSGDVADAFYIVRLGHVKVLREGQVIDYLWRGKYFGEIGLLNNVPRSGTCVASDEVELLRIGKATFDALLKRQPSIRSQVVEEAGKRLERDAVRASKVEMGDTENLAEYLRQELFQGQSLLLIDLDLCTRCDECVRACAQSHGGIPRLIRDGERFQNYLVPKACRSCHDPKCLSGCPVDAIHRTKAGGLAIIVEDHCIGCGFCFGEDHAGNRTGTGCPYGNIFPKPYERVDPLDGHVSTWRQAAVCDLDNCTAEQQDPSCVYACPHEAAQRVNAKDFFGRKIHPHSV